MNTTKTLQDLIIKFDIRVKVKALFCGQMREVEFHIGNKSWKLLIDDEYLYLNEKYQPISLYMALRELSIYKEEDDFLAWCHQNESDANSPQILNYYRDLDSTHTEITSFIGTIDLPISNLDYDLRSGEFEKLLKAI